MDCESVAGALVVGAVGGALHAATKSNAINMSEIFIAYLRRIA
jgi:hypothetical protein